MLGLPKNTEVHQQLPKTSVYKKFNLNTAEKNAFDSDKYRKIRGFYY